MLNLPTQHEVQAMRDAGRYDAKPKAITGKHAKLSKSAKSVSGLMTGDGEAVTVEPKPHGRPVPEGPSAEAAKLQADLDAAKADIVERDSVIAGHVATIAALQADIATLRASKAVPASDTRPAEKASKGSRAAYYRELREKKKAAAKG